MLGFRRSLSDNQERLLQSNICWGRSCWYVPFWVCA